MLTALIQDLIITTFYWYFSIVFYLLVVPNRVLTGAYVLKHYLQQLYLSVGCVHNAITMIRFRSVKTSPDYQAQCTLLIYRIKWVFQNILQTMCGVWNPSGSGALRGPYCMDVESSILFIANPTCYAVVASFRPEYEF